MTTNTDTGDENFKNSINTKPENPSDGNISSEETDNITQKQETENMEVHHHSHSYGKKKMESLCMGIFNVIPCSILWFFGRVSVGAYN